MSYLSEAVGSALGPKLLGCYEMELHPPLEAIIDGRFELLIDIGSAEGYYAVGFLARCSSIWWIAFEPSERARDLLARLASVNGVVERLDIRGRCGPAELLEVLGNSRNPVIVCDIEGSEQEVLDPAHVPQLREASILIELHEFIRPGVSTLIRQRFSHTHHIHEIQSTSRHIDELPKIRLRRQVVMELASEHRPCGTTWLWMTPGRF